MSEGNKKISFDEFVRRCGSLDAAAKAIGMKPEHLERWVRGELVPYAHEIDLLNGLGVHRPVRPPPDTTD